MHKSVSIPLEMADTNLLKFFKLISFTLCKKKSQLPILTFRTCKDTPSLAANNVVVTAFIVH